MHSNAETRATRCNERLMMPTEPRPSVLIDSNVLIAAEDHGTDGHACGADAANLLRLVQKLEYSLLISHGTRSDVLRAPEPRRSQRLRALEKYIVLEPVPENPAVSGAFPPKPNANDRADCELLTAFATGRAHWLVTDDRQLRNRAAAAGLDNVLRLSDAVAMFSALSGSVPAALPAVTFVKAYQIAPAAQIFATLRADYPPFDEWWRSKVVPGNRDVAVIGEPTSPIGIAVLKPEDDGPYGLPNDTLKICTFKVSGSHQQVKLGEALLRACIEYTRAASRTTMYVEVLPGKADLLGWLYRFGFVVVDGADAPNGQVVLRKALKPPPGAELLDPLHHETTYGPGSIRLQRAHAVPIQNQWHHLLFPDADPQGDLFAGTDGCGNAIRKAYLSRAQTRQIAPGDALLFLRTGSGESAFSTVGVVEDTLVSNDPDEIVRFVGVRTVYSRIQIAEMCASGDVLAILFRHDRVIAQPISLSEALAAKVLKAAPQSAMTLSEEAVTWLRQRLDA